MEKIKLLDTVVLIEDTPTTSFDNGQTVLLRRGQVGTVVEEYDNGDAFEVEFSDEQGNDHALLTVKAEKLIPLQYNLLKAG